MCTCILFPTLTKKAYTKVKGVLRGIKTVPRPQEFYRARTALAGFEISCSATETCQIHVRTG